MGPTYSYEGNRRIFYRENGGRIAKMRHLQPLPRLTEQATFRPFICIHFYGAMLRHRTLMLFLRLNNKALRHEGVWGSGCIDPCFLDLGTSWRWMLSFTPGPPYPRGKSPWYPSDRRLGRPQRRSGRRGEEKNLDPTRIRTPDSWVVQLVANRNTDWAIPAPLLRYQLGFHIGFSFQ
jgi:hypothetical protein